ncbi:hypothetical protein [Xanthocytophaga agilis]|uniref:Uncharacterized protein n=1 Tax=Xanthocytophaga agilis TaxID=3048010 RepID=A0AAE3R8J3_9BACT|nr:hypothetical protein [Xanthocytophaga agilis]MDJ1503395.1 hypothetical protein [Xanthocytophaga agilis]
MQNPSGGIYKINGMDQKIKQLYDYWSSRKTQCYKKDDLIALGLYGDEVEILSTIGLPYMNRRFNFFPIEQLQLIQIQEEEFIVLGNPLNERFDDETIIMHIQKKSLFFLDKRFYNLGVTTNLISLVNQNLFSFLFFQMELSKMEEAAFFMKEPLPYQILENQIVNSVYLMHQTDPDGLGWDSKGSPDHSYWKRQLAVLEGEIYHQYEEFISIAIDEKIS